MLELNFSPFPNLQTDRLLLRNISHDDASALLELRSDDGVMEYIGRPKMKTEEEAMIFIKNILESVEKNDSIFWAIAEKELPEQMIGTICFWRIEKEHFRAELGYLLHKNFWQKGLMKEAASRVIRWLFETTAIHSIEANLDASNVASEKLLESLGFIKEGHFKENFYFNGKFTDSATYSILRK
jgi:[ribosomal protein S5]-alanine N-acetyltransferase